MFDHMPKTDIQSKNEQELVAQLVFPEDYHYFKGHFPDFPLLPGMIQIHLAIKYAETHFQLKGQFSGLSGIKFSKPILPNELVQLKLGFDSSANTLNFQFLKDEKTIYSKGQVNFEPN